MTFRATVQAPSLLSRQRASQLQQHPIEKGGLPGKLDEQLTLHMNSSAAAAIRRATRSAPEIPGWVKHEARHGDTRREGAAMSGGAGSRDEGGADLRRKAGAAPARKPATLSHAAEDQQELHVAATIRALTLRTIREMRQKMKADLANLHQKSEAVGMLGSLGSGMPGGGGGDTSGARDRPRSRRLVNLCDLWGCETGEEVRRGGQLSSTVSALHDAIPDAHYNVLPLSVDSLSSRERRGHPRGDTHAHEGVEARPYLKSSRRPRGGFESTNGGEGGGGSGGGGGGARGWWEVARYKSTSGLQQMSAASAYR